MRSVILLALPAIFLFLDPAAALAKKEKGAWVKIKNWHRCERMLKKGSVFELRNAEGQKMLATCNPRELPPRPEGWLSDAVRFRVIKEPKPERSPEMQLPKSQMR